jgi:hypothetical protein
VDKHDRAGQGNRAYGEPGGDGPKVIILMMCGGYHLKPPEVTQTIAYFDICVNYFLPRLPARDLASWHRNARETARIFFQARAPANDAIARMLPT